MMSQNETNEFNGRTTSQRVDRSRSAFEPAAYEQHLFEEQAPQSLTSGTPERIGDYLLGREFVRRPKSVIYFGSGLLKRDTVAIKFQLGPTSRSVQLAKHEFRALHRLAHPRIIRARQIVRFGDRLGIAFDALDKRSIVDVVRGSRPVGVLPDLSAFAKVVSGLLSGLAHVHSRGWVHGAVCADHVLFDREGNGSWIDFAQCSNRFEPSWLQTRQSLVPSSPYLAPELLCEPPSDPAQDMFGMGRLMALLLSGRMPSWYPGEAIAVSDRRVAQQLPADTPQHLVNLCARLVRMAFVQRPSAEMAYADITGNDWIDTADTRDSVSRLQWINKTKSIAFDACRRAASGRGSVILLDANLSELDTVYRIFDEVHSNDARLILNSVCFNEPQAVLPAFESLFDLLSNWFEQLSPTLQNKWKEAYSPLINCISPSLARVFGQSVEPIGAPTSHQIQQAIRAFGNFVAALSEHRTMVILLHQIENMDRVSSALLKELVFKTKSCPIILATTTSSLNQVLSNPHIDNLGGLYL